MLKTNSLTVQQENFVEKELWTLTWNASVQRVGLYKKDASKEDKQSFRNALIDFIKTKIIPNYKKSKVSEKKHYKYLADIITFAERKNGFGKKVLRNNCYKLGSAQKLLNLSLKYYWCCHKISKPPHCPVDYIVLSKLNINDTRWTKLKEMDEYKAAIEKIKKAIGNDDLSQWELLNWAK